MRARTGRSGTARRSVAGGAALERAAQAVELNRAVAAATADPSEGPRLALEIVDGLTALDGSYLLPSVRGELLARLGRNDEAAAEFASAAELTDNECEREVLKDKAIRARRG